MVEVEVEVVEQGGAAEPIGVDMHERRAACEVRVGAREHEGGALHRTPHAEAVADAARQGGLARAERTGEQHEVAGAQPAREVASEGLHRGGQTPTRITRVPSWPGALLPATGVRARHARPDPGDDLVADGAGGLGPLVGGGRAGRRVAEDHDLVARLDVRVADVDDELVHRDAADHRSCGLGQQHLGAAARRVARDAVGVASGTSARVVARSACQMCAYDAPVPGVTRRTAATRVRRVMAGVSPRSVQVAVAEGRQPVHADADAHHVVARLRIADRLLGRGEVPGRGRARPRRPRRAPARRPRAAPRRRRGTCWRSG